MTVRPPLFAMTGYLIGIALAVLVVTGLIG